MQRLFVAVPIPDQIKEELLELKINIPGARWTKEDQLHITLKFIGDVEGQVFKTIKEKLLEVDMAKFQLQIKSVGYFPPGNFSKNNGPKILWAGVENNEFLIRLRNLLERSLSESGIRRDSRKFNPHITLARLKNPNTERIADFISSYNNFKTEPFLIEEFRLYSSKLYPMGAVHNIEGVYLLD